MSVLSHQPVLAPLPPATTCLLVERSDSLHFDMISPTEQARPRHITHSLPWCPICTTGLACSLACSKLRHTRLDTAHIPIEISERIIDAIHAYRVVDGIKHSRMALKRCSLVCRAWRPRSQHWLMYAVEVEDTYGLNRLYQHLRMASCSAGSVRELYLTSPYLHRPDSIINSLSSNPGHRLPNIRVLSLICNPSAPRRQNLPFLPIHRRFPPSFHSFRHLNEVRLINLRFPSFSDLARLLYSAPRLRDLSCVNITWVSQGTFPSFVSGGATNLKNTYLPDLERLYVCCFASWSYCTLILTVRL